MPLNKIFFGLLIIFNISFGLDRCDVYKVFLDACANFGIKGGSCDEFKSKLNEMFNSSKSSKIFIDACFIACKAGSFNKNLSNLGIDTFIKICKIAK